MYMRELEDELFEDLHDEVSGQPGHSDEMLRKKIRQAIKSVKRARNYSGAGYSIDQIEEDIDGDKVLLCSPALYGAIRKANGWIPGTELAAERIIRGSVGMIHGCEIVVSNRLASVSRTTYAKTSDVAINSSKTYYVVDADGNYTAVATPDVDDIATYYEATTASAQEAYIVKPGALAIYTKRGTMVEFDRDKLCQTNFIIGSKIFAPYLYDENKIIKLSVS